MLYIIDSGVMSLEPAATNHDNTEYTLLGTDKIWSLEV